MATYYIVEDGTAVLPDEINAGTNIDLNAPPYASGDTFIFRGNADKNTTFQDGAGSGKSVIIQFEEDSTGGGYTVSVTDGLNATMTVDAGVDISDVNFNLNSAGDVALTTGDNASIGAYSGSDSGADTVVLGLNNTVNGDIGTGAGGPANLTVGDGSLITGNVIVGDDGSTIDLGTTDVQGGITLGDGADDLTFGGTITGTVDTGLGNDTITVEAGAVLDAQFITGGGADSITIGDGADFNGDIDLGTGNDTVTAGDNVTFDGSQISLNDGNDSITIGDSAVINAQINDAGGDDTVTIGDDATIAGGVDLGAEDDTLIVGQNADITANIDMNNGANTLTIGDGYDANGNAIILGDGADDVDIGDVSGTNTDALDLDTGKGNDTVHIGDLDSTEANSIVLGVSSDMDHLYLEVSDPTDKTTIAAALTSAGYTQSGKTWTSPDGASPTATDVTWNNTTIENTETITIVCFARGTHIETDQGERPIEQLQPGDRVRTLDNGFQPIRWIGSSTVPAIGTLAPVRIKAGTLGNTRDLVVSPQHRMLLSGWQMELFFGEPEVLASAKSLVNDTTIRRETGGTVQYFHMLFDDHEIVFAEGAPSESFYPGNEAMDSFEQATRDEILQLFPELEDGPDAFGPIARMSLRGTETRLAVQALSEMHDISVARFH